MPARGRLVDHPLLNFVDAFPGSGKRSCICNIFSAIAHSGETLGDNTRTLWPTIGTGMTETAVVHIPTVQPCSTGQRLVPGIRIEPTSRTVAINQGKKPLR